LTNSEIELVNNFINAVKTKSPEKIADFLPDQESRIEFVKKFDLEFDENFIESITKSNPKTDWESVGWRGIMFNNGELWLDLDGTLREVNHITKRGIAKKKIARCKLNFLQNFQEFRNIFRFHSV